MQGLNIKYLDRICAALLVLMLLSGSYLIFIHYGKEKERLSIEAAMISKRKHETNLARNDLAGLKTLLKTTKAKVSQINERVPAQGKIGRLLTAIDSVVSRRGGALVRIQPLPTVQGRIYMETPIQLVCSGSFKDLFHLVHDLEKMNRVMVMEKLTITQVAASNRCKAELIVRVFERPDNKG